jgi:uncharacterized protein (DUF1501 family)
MANSRRDFLKKSIGLVSLSTVAPHLWVRSASANARRTAIDRTLVVLQLDGGNDGLNTIVPYAQGAYYDARPTLGVAASDVIHLDSAVGLHPSLAPLKPLYDAQKLAIVQGAGYPDPNRSHFRSREIWQTADPIEVDATGWLGRYADAHLADGGELAAVNIGGSLPKSLNANTVVVPSIVSLQSYQFLTDPAYTGDAQNQVNCFLSVNDRPAATGDELALATNARDAYSGSTELQAAAGGYTPRATYPDNSRLAADLQFAAQIITAGVGARILYLTTGGYDTHANQSNDHPRLFADLAASLAAFQADIEGQGLADSVALLAFSEFGRRVEENGSDGTDHGTAGPMLLLGTEVAGGLHGVYPSLTSLDTNGDLVFTVDFREVYADALETWLGVESHDILEGDFTPAGVFRA